MAFQVRVPLPSNNGNIIIVKLDVIIRFNIDPTNIAGVALNVTNGQGVTKRFPAAGFMPVTPAGNTLFFPAPPGSEGADLGYVELPPNAPPNDPNLHRYRLFLELKSDYDIDNGAITTAMTADETWTIGLEFENAVPNDAASVCVASFQFGANLNDPQPILLPASGATVVNEDFPNQSACAESRPGIDVVLVLDKSGSMASSTLGGQPRSKIEALRSAVKDFVGAWSDLRASEGADAPSDTLGVVLFDSTASWWPVVSGGGTVPFTDTLKNNIIAALDGPSPNNIPPGGSTSIGAGLLLADGAFAAVDPTNPPGNQRRRVILLMSNGLQNTSPLVGITPTNPPRIFTHTSGQTTGPDVPNQSKYQVYAVTVGTGAAVSAQINEDIAATTSGFYINTEVSAESLRTFFLELLQNFIRFNTWETVRLLSATTQLGAPFSTEIPISSTTREVQFTAVWPELFGTLVMTAIPPRRDPDRGPNPISGQGVGSIRLRYGLPPREDADNYDPFQPWRVVVEVPSIIEITHGVQGIGSTPFDLVVMADDLGVNADIGIVPLTYTPGDQIQLRAVLTELGRPVRKLGSQPGDIAVAQIIKPGTSIGDLLSTSGAGTGQPNPDDQRTAADAKLFNTLQENPGALQLANDTATLQETADGIYTGSFTAREPGHYHFLFGIQGGTEQAARFSRQQIKSVFVRAIPATNTTSIETSIQRGDGGNRFVITFTPRTGFENRLGPGFANYFWFTSPGRAPFKPIDNLDGTYRASLPIVGNTVPRLSLHFLPVSIVIGDDVRPDQLPLPLDRSTPLVPVVPGSGTGGGLEGCLGLLVGIIRALIELIRSILGGK